MDARVDVEVTISADVMWEIFLVFVKKCTENSDFNGK